MQINQLPNLQRDIYPDTGINNKQKLSELSIADLVAIRNYTFTEIPSKKEMERFSKLADLESIIWEKEKNLSLKK